MTDAPDQPSHADGEPSEVHDPGKMTKSLYKAVSDWVIVIALALFAAFVVRTFLLQQFYISGPSMESTLYQNNRVLVNKLSYRFSGVGRGDIVVFDRVTSNGAEVVHDDLIKRVIGLENETLEVKQCVVYINNEPLEENYLDEFTRTEPDLVARCRTPDMHPVTIPDNYVFVMGDNRAESFDSRSFGAIEESKIVGRAFAVVWPLSKIGLL
jgi:signal peptidase I